MPSSSIHYAVQAQISLVGLLLGFRVYVPNRDWDHVVSELSNLIEKYQLEYINVQDLGNMNQLINECNEVPAYACEYDRYNELQEIDVIWVVPRHLDRIYNAFEVVSDISNRAQVIRIAFDHLRQGLLNLRIIENKAYIICPDDKYRSYAINKCIQDKYLIDNGNCVFNVLTMSEIEEILEHIIRFNELNRKYSLGIDVESIVDFAHGIPT